MPRIELTLVIGQYALDWHLKNQKKKNLTESVKAWKEYSPKNLVLAHPSPRNNIWLKKNPWFQVDILPKLRKRISLLLKSPSSNTSGLEESQEKKNAKA